MADPSLDLILKKPFAEQVAFFRQKLGNLVPTEAWDDLWKSQHDKAFMVAGAMQADLLTDLAAATERLISEGKSIEAFRRDFDAIVERHGWAFRGERNWRTRVIAQANLSTSYAAGREAQIAAGGFPFAMYKHSDSVVHPRPLHLSWDGLVLPVDHPFRKTHGTPNGWGCNCRWIGIRNEAAARRLGGRWGDHPPEGWDKIDPKTGEQVGIDKGWGYTPGGTVKDIVNQMAAKTQQWDYTLAKAYMQSLPDSARDALAQAYRGLPSVADDALRFAARALAGNPDDKPYRTLGLLTQRDIGRVNDLVKPVDVTGYDYALDASAVAHVKRRHGDPLAEAKQGQRAVVAEDYARLPGLLIDPDSVENAGLSDIGRPVVKFSKEIDGELYVAVFEARSGRKMLALQSLWVRKP